MFCFFQRAAFNAARVLLLALAVGLSASAWAADPKLVSLTPVTEPYPAPALRFKDLNGKQHDLADLKGKLVVVNFWATWCPPCRREMPSLERLNKRLGGRGLVVLAVAAGEDADTVREFLPKLKPAPSFPMLVDPDFSVMQSWNMRGLPTTFVIDPAGRVIYSAVGEREFAHETLIKRLLPHLPGK